MTTKENARWQAGDEVICASNNSTPTNEQHGFRAKLRSPSELLVQHLATVTMIELERPKLHSQLLAAGWWAPVQQGGAV